MHPGFEIAGGKNLWDAPGDVLSLSTLDDRGTSETTIRRTNDSQGNPSSSPPPEKGRRRRRRCFGFEPLHASCAGLRQTESDMGSCADVFPVRSGHARDPSVLLGSCPWWPEQHLPVGWFGFDSRRFVHSHEISLTPLHATGPVLDGRLCHFHCPQIVDNVVDNHTAVVH